MPRFYDGQPVICVDDRLRRHVTRRYPGLVWPKRGQRYVIRRCALPVGGKLTFVLVHEIRNRVIQWPNGRFYEAGFHEDRFEPATDITLLENVRDFAGALHDAHRTRNPVLDPSEFEYDPKKEKARLESIARYIIDEYLRGNKEPLFDLGRQYQRKKNG